MLAAMLPRLLSDGRRVLIFSQLKGVLTLLEVGGSGSANPLPLRPPLYIQQEPRNLGHCFVWSSSHVADVCG